MILRHGIIVPSVLLSIIVAWPFKSEAFGGKAVGVRGWQKQRYEDQSFNNNNSILIQKKSSAFTACWATTSKTDALEESSSFSGKGSITKEQISANEGGNRRIPVPSARSVAVSALMENKKSQSSEFALQRLEQDRSFTSLSDQRDRSFARLLVVTAERRRGQIDKILAQCMTTSTPKRGKQDAFVIACLRLGAAQLLFLDVPHYAAIKETVQVLRMNPKLRIPEPKIKFANAVLRRIGREGEQMLESLTTPLDNLSPWLLDEWNALWGEEQTNKMVDQMMEEPSIDLSIKSIGKTTKDRNLEIENVQKEFGESATILPHGSIRVGKNTTGAVTEWPLYNEGLWWVQDASATLPAIALHNALEDNYGNVNNLHVVDMCAAPGGKTAQLISLGFGSVTAIEVSPRRSRRLVENLERLNFQEKCTVVVNDASKWIPDESNVAGVIVDVPCSATGTGSRRPDVLRREKCSLDNLLETQERLAKHCAENILDVGGIMVYATCSLLKQESEDQVQKMIDSSNVETLPFVPGEIPGFDKSIDQNGWLRVLPGVLPGELESCDGFFVARLVKVDRL